MEDAPASDSSTTWTPVVVLMGVSGVGKTSVGTAVARRLGWEFFDGDDFHPESNVEKMSRGIPLDDADREGWLQQLRNLIERQMDEERPAIVACSALKKRYRNVLAAGRSGVVFVYLRAPQDVVADRIRDRSEHFFDSALLASQYDALEEPADAVTVDAARPLAAVIEEAASALENLRPEAS